MSRSKRPRHTVIALGLAALLLVPFAARAADGDEPPTGSSIIGVAMAMVCGASFGIARILPAPIVIATGAAACLVMLMDAMASPDTP